MQPVSTPFFASRLGRPAVAALLVSLAVPLKALVITEVLYHPPEVDNNPYEYIEIYNENADPLDLTGYTICKGVQFAFPPDTWIEGRSYLVVCAIEANIQSTYGITNTVGDWYTDPATSPSLSNGGERIEICNPGGRTVATVRYNDRGKWPSGADGTGHSLSLISPFLEPDDPDSWTLSLALGGTPGEPNGHETEDTGGPKPAQGLDGAGFVLKWLVLGPYTGSSCALGPRLSGDWLRGNAGGVKEADLLWTNGQVVNTNYSLAESDGLHANAGTALPTIKTYSGATDTINFNDVVWPPNPDFVMAYAFVYIDNVTAAPLLVDIGVASDDAISVLINGSYVHVNDACRGVGAPGEVQDRAPATLAVGKNLVVVKVFENQGGWSFRLRFEQRGTTNPITLPSAIQVMTDHTKGLRFGGGGTPIEPTDPPPPPPPGAGAGESPVVINEALLRTAGERWVEIHNRSNGPIDISGYRMTDEPANLTKATIPGGTSIAAGGYVSFTDAQLGLDFSPALAGGRVFIALVSGDGQRVLDAFNFEPQFTDFSEARLGGDDKKFSDACDPTRDAANATSVNTSVVINEIMYHPPDNDNRKEFVELYNRGGAAVDLTGWSLSDGLNFSFPAGTMIAAGAYLIVARDPSLYTGPASIYQLPAGQVFGPTTPEALAALGGLRNSGERLTLSDEMGRTVDTVRFREGGEWPRWADGHGSSLELIDARQDNRYGQAWDASDDSAKATTRTFSYVGRHIGGESELAVVLLDRGITLVDDVSIIGGGITNNDTVLIDSGTSWRYFKGTVAPPANWTTVGFVDTGWLSGTTGIGYGDNDDATTLTDMQNGYRTIFCRKMFTIANVNDIDKLILSVSIDDGFYAYLNGNPDPVATHNVTSPAFDADAPSAGEPTIVEKDITARKAKLVNGTNVLAIQVHNAGIGSTDLSFNPRLLDRTTTTSGGSEQLTNGHFNANTTGWIIEGTHIRSGRTTQSPISGAGSLKILAAARGDNKVNRIETPDTAGTGMGILTANEDVLISFKARWVVGSQTILTHGYEHEMAQSHDLGIPLNLGTPGARNQGTGRLIAETGGSNLGPVITSVGHEPQVPGAGEAVKVSARLLDADGVGTVTLRYSLNDPSASPASVVMARVTGTDRWEGTIPGQALGTRVVFFITATDAGGRAARYPIDITKRSHPLLLNPPAAGLNDHRYCIYAHDVKNPATSFHSYRFYMTAAAETELTNRRLLSNDPVDGSFVFGGSKVYYESQTRFSGSPFARAGWNGSFRVRMPRDNPLHGRIKKFGLEDHHGNGGDARERLSHYLIRQNQGALGVPYSDVFIMTRWQVNARSPLTREHYWVPDGEFVSLWFPSDDEGDFLEMDDRFVINDTGGRVGNTDARVLYPPTSSRSDGNGDNKENYRWFFGLRAKNGADEYANFIAFAKVLAPGATPDALLDQQIWDFMNVEEMLRIWAVEMNIDDWDSWGQSRGKNCYFYRPDFDGRFHLMAWDLELTYGNTTSFAIPPAPTDPFNPGGFAEVNRLMNRPAVRRMYYAILNEMVNGPDAWFNSGYVSPYMTRLAALGMTNTGLGQPGGYIDQRANFIRPRLNGVLAAQVAVAITTNGGANFTTAQATANFAGTAPVEVAKFLVTQNGDEGSVYTPSYPTMTTWTIPAIPLGPGANNLVFYGLDLNDELVGDDRITVTSTANWPAPSITLLNPSTAAAGVDIKIEGTGFHNGVRVFFGASESPTVVYNEAGPTPGIIVARVPAGTGTVNLTVRNADNKNSNALSFSYPPPVPTFVRGDANGDTRIDLADAVKILLHQFAGSPTDCLDALDVDDTEAIDVTDTLYLLQYLFRNGPAPRSPFPGAAADPSGTALDCER